MTLLSPLFRKRRNLKPNPYLADTTQHLFNIAIGAAPGYTPAIDDEKLPLNILEKVFIESYGLAKYFPTFFHPSIIISKKKNTYLLFPTIPSTHTFSPKSRVLAH